METLHDVLRLLVAKAADHTLQPDEAEEALAIIHQDEILKADTSEPDSPSKTKKGGA
jgi:hypothetical protein